MLVLGKGIVCWFVEPIDWCCWWLGLFWDIVSDVGIRGLLLLLIWSLSVIFWYFVIPTML